MKKSYNSIFMLILVMILAISAVSAADIDETSDLTVTEDDSTILEVEDTSEEVQAASEEEVMADSGDGNNFTSLKTLINEASSSLTLNKDYTRVSEDSDIEIDKDFTINGQDTYTIDANNLGGIFKVKNGYTLTLTGVTLINGNSDYGSAVYVEDGAILNAENCKFNQNTAVYRGGAIYSEGTVDVKDSIFKSNDITHRTENKDYGGAGIANIDGTLTVDNCEFSDNVKDYVIRGTDGKTGDLLDGAAILTTGDTTITNSDFFNNSACYGGAFTAIPITSRKTATITIDNCNFTDNLAYDGGAMYIGWDADYDYTISNSWFENNVAAGIGSTGYTAAGGAIFSVYNSGSGSITKSTFKDNKVIDSTYTAGGAINIEDTSSVNIEECVFDGNTVDYLGGAIEVATGGHGASTVSVDKSNFTNNVAYYGGAIFSDSTTTLTVSNSLFEDNTATYGITNSIYNLGELTLTGNDFGAGQDVISTSTVSGTFTDLQNQINNAQGSLDLAYDFAFVEGYDVAYANGVVIANPITINGNGYTISGSNAARIFNVTSGTLTLNDLSLTNGAASEGAAVYISSGAKLDATDVTLSNNVALDNGGAIYTDGGEIALENCVLDANDVTNLETSGSQNMGGAAIYAKNAQVTLVNTNVTNNGRNELDRSQGDLINAVINLINSDATITGGLFENNTGIYGGAIIAIGDGTQVLTVSGATFKNNKAYNGGAIDIESMIATISDCTFENNWVVGPGSTGYYGVGGAIAAEGKGSFSLTGSNFTNNKATGINATAGAVSVGLDEGYAAIIDDCEFKDNTAVLKAGAVFANSYDFTISNSRFSGDNEAGMGNAIYNGGYLALSGNTIDSDDAQIYSVNKIDTHVWVIVNDNQDMEVEYYDTIPIVLKITDDNGNVIRINEPTLTIDLGSTFSRQTLTLDEDTGFYTLDAYLVEYSGLLTPNRVTLGKYFTYKASNNLNSSRITMIKATPTVEVVYENVTNPDVVVINITVIGKEGAPKISWANTTSTPFKIVVNNVTYKVKITNGVGSVTIPNLAVGNYVINASWDGNTKYNGIEPQLYNLLVSPVKGTFTDLQYIIDNDEFGLIFLPYDFKYDPDYDADLVNGVVIDKNLYILGMDYTIDANNSARIFNVTDGAIFKIDDATLTNGHADYGGAVYVDAGSFLNTQNVVLYNNTATYRGGAIYSEGTVDVMDSVLDSNDITFRTKNDDNGGAAIYNLKGDLSISNSNITNNLKDIVIRDGNNGDLLAGVVVTSGYTFIEDSYFANNTGSWGGAISSVGYMNDESYVLSVKNTKFEGNNATFGGAIFVESSILEVDNCTFENNKGVGVGSSGTSNTQGGAILVHPAGASATISNSTFIANSANIGGAVSLAGVDEDSIIDNCTFIDNTATADGGALYFWTDGAGIAVYDSEFINNAAPYGGAIENEGIGDLTVLNSIFTENTASLRGGAIISSGNTEVSNSIFTDNVALGNTNAIYLYYEGTELALLNNTITGDTVQILVKSGISIDTPLSAIFLGNQTVPAYIGDMYILNATLTDDNGNFIYDADLRFSVNGEEIDEILFDEETGLYTVGYYIENAGLEVISTNYELDGLVKYTGILDVPKINVTEFTVKAFNTLEGKNATVWITLKANETGLNSFVTVIVNNKEYMVSVEDGLGNITIEGLAHGQYPVVAILDDPNYNYLINSSVFFVKGQAKLNVTELTVAEYGDVIEIAINLTDSEGNPLSGIVVVNEVINVLVENGVGTFVIDDQPDVGYWAFQAVYDGDNDYFGDLAPFDVNITTKVIDPNDIVVDIPTFNEFGEAIPVTITSPVDGVFTVNINGTAVEVEVVNGTGSAEITLDNPGIYNATVDIVDEGYSLETITTDEFEYKTTPEFNVVITGTYPKAEISITGPAGTYHVNIDGMEPVNITREESGLPTLEKITNIGAGNYTAFVSFDAHDEYYGDYKEINFTVNKAALDIIELEVIGDKVESPINITFTLPADVDPSTVSAFIDGSPVPVGEFVINETTGVYTLPLDGFPAAGGHLFTVQVNDPNYEEDGAQVTFTIEKITPTLVVSDASAEWDTPVDIPIKLTGADGTPITGKVIVTVSWNVDGVTKVVNLDENGESIANFRISDAVGDLKITASFDGNDKYNATETNATLTIIDIVKMAVEADSQLDYDNIFHVNVTLTDAMDIPMANAVVSYAVNEGEAQTISTDENGYVSIPVTGLAAGESNIVVSYEDEFGNVTTKTVAVNVNQILPVFHSEASENNVVGQNVTITVNAPGATGNVTLTVDGELVGRDALVDGVVVFEVSGLDAGHHSYLAIYEGNENYTTTNDVNSFDVAKAETTVTIEVDGDIGVMGGATVNVTVSNNVAGYISIDDDGVVSVVEITNGTYSFEIYDLQAGEYCINVTFLGNDNYLKSNATKVLNIPKSAATPEITDVTPDETLGNDVLIFVDMNNDFVSGNVTVFVDGVENQTVAIDEDYGMALVTIPGLTIGDHTIGVKYNGDDNYDASDIVTLTLNIDKADSKVTIDPIDNVTYGEEVLVSYTVENQTNVEIIVYYADEKIEPEMETADGIIAIKGLTPGDYLIYIENNASDKYNESFAIGYFTVGKAASSVTIVEIDDLVYPGSGEVLYEIENKTEEQLIVLTFNGAEIEVQYDDESIQLTDLAAGEYTLTIINADNELYNESEASISFKVLKADPTFTSDVTENAKVGENVTITVTAPADATGNVTVTVDGELIGEVPVVNGAATVNVTGLAAGHHSYEVTYDGDDNYEIASDLNSFNVVKNTPEIIIADIENPVVGNTVQTTVTVADGNATGYVIYNKVAYKLENGKATIDVGISEAGIQTITVKYLGDDKYSNGTGEKAFNAAKAPTTIELEYDEIDTVVGRDVSIDYTINPMVAKGNVTLWIDDVEIYNEEIFTYTGNIIIKSDKLPTNGTYTVKVQYIGTENYADSENATLVINVEDETVNINITVPENTTTPVFNITVPTDATGLLLVDVDGKHYYAPVENGTASIAVPGLEPGNYTANVTYTGDDFYDGATKTVEFTVPANADENSITIPEGATTTNPTFSIDLPSDATGYFEVDVDGKKYVVPVENGTAKISIPGLAPGDHNVTVKYSGDSKYNGISKSTTLKLKEPVAKLSNNKNIKVVYSGKATYKVLLTLDGNAAAGEKVTIKYNGKTYTVKTNSKGYATLKLNTKVKVKKYTITAEYKGVKVSNKVTIKHVIKASNKKAKKSKKLVLKVKTKKVNGKFLKGKKLKLKFRGKTYKAKISKKGVAKFTIKKKVMKKLKKGKKYKYTVTYGKDKVTKKIKIK